MNGTPRLYRADDLALLDGQVLVAAGLEREKAEVVAQGLLEGELMGATTHGLALLAAYVEELEKDFSEVKYEEPLEISPDEAIRLAEEFLKEKRED